jgi:hypothetical protein
MNSWQSYGLKEVRKASRSISQGKDLATRERQGYALEAARISLKSQLLL